MRSLRLVAMVVAVTVLAGCAAQPGVSNAPASATSPPPTVPNGSWTMTLTAEDLRNAGFTDPGAAAENAGTVTLTLAPDGTWTMAQVASQPVRWPVFRGSYTATGEDTIEMRTTFPPEYAGDLVSVRLTEVSEGLAIKLLSPDDPLLRLQLEGHVWAPLP